jgi:hypothetical protein
MATTLALATGASALVCLTIFPPAQTKRSQWWFSMVAATTRGPQLWPCAKGGSLPPLRRDADACASSLLGFWRTTACRVGHLRPMTSDGDDGTPDKKPTASSVNRPEVTLLLRRTRDQVRLGGGNPDLGRAAKLVSATLRAAVPPSSRSARTGAPTLVQGLRCVRGCSIAKDFHRPPHGESRMRQR